MNPNHSSDDDTSHLIDLTTYDTHGLCSKYTLRRHKYESEANGGCYEARSDWIKYIGPIEQFGGCNPVNGNFSSLVLPLCKPERLRLVAYILEYAFLFDNMVELVTDDPALGEGPHNHEWSYTNPALGKTQIQAKMMMQLGSTDRECTKRVKLVWEEMLTTTLRDKDRDFASLEDYVDFRIVDTGAPFVEAMLLFGMGTILTEEEDRQLESVRKPCYAALGLANDYFSFDREFDEFQACDGEAQTFTNSVWLHMKWHKVDVAAAKNMVKQATQRYEAQFLDLCAEYRRRHSPLADQIDRYLRALAYQVSGNVVWSLNCPRYHPDHRYDPNAGLEDSLTNDKYCQSLRIEALYSGNLSAGNVGGHEAGAIALRDQRRESTGTTMTTETKDDSTFDDSSSQTGSRSSYDDREDDPDHCRSKGASTTTTQLDDRHIQAPFEYITSLPSKGVRDTFIDALNVWLAVPEPTVSRIKSLGGRLHSASLMLDDIEDGSALRRSQPATHKVFGIAQTINSGCYEILRAVSEASQLGLPSAVDIILEALDELHVGQSYDLYWTRHNICPSETEYLEMVDKKTGGLFRLLARLMVAASPRKFDAQLSSSIEALVSLVGVQFQIRDDYQNLQSVDYANQKGFCEDLDEGKFSFPLIHALSCESQEQILRELLRQRQTLEGLSREHKVLILKEFEQAGSLQYTKDILKQTQGRINAQLRDLEYDTGLDNWILRALLQKLEV